MIMPGSPRISGEAFAIERLREDPDLDYAAVRRLADEAGVAMQPILYGRARRHLGLPPARNKGPVLPTETRRETTPEPIEIEARDETPMDTTPEADAGDAAEEAAPSPKKKGSVAFEFLVAELRREPNMLYAELRRRAEAKGFPIAPIMYGRAKAVLGLVPVKPRGSKKDKEAAAAAATAPAAPRVLKQVESVAADRFSQKLEEVRNLDQLVQAVKELDAERRRLRGLLEKIVTMIDEALG